MGQERQGWGKCRDCSGGRLEVGVFQIRVNFREMQLRGEDRVLCGAERSERSICVWWKSKSALRGDGCPEDTERGGVGGPCAAWWEGGSRGTAGALLWGTCSCVTLPAECTLEMS